MTPPKPPEVRGACPGALIPMQSGDGLIVRVRPQAGVLSLAEMEAVARAAATFGSGEIDLTRRANLQLRGVQPDALAGLQEALRAAGLLDATAEAETVRNIVVGPLADLEAPARQIARELAAIVARDEGLWGLSPKFGFVIDDGGPVALDDIAGDVFLRVLSADQALLGIAGPSGPRWLGRVAIAAAAGSMAAAARVVVTTTRLGSRTRLVKADAALIAAIRDAIELDPVGEAPAPRYGAARFGTAHGCVSVGAPFGRLDAATLRAIASAAARAGAGHVRVAPWRALTIPVSSPEAGQSVLDAARALDLVVEDADPLAAIDACPGAPACTCAYGDTRAAARKVAALFARLGIRSAHVSGCAKGCARSTKADLVLVGEADGFGIIRNGTSADAPAAHVNAALDGLPEALHG